MNDKILFIGGPKDGKRERLPNSTGLQFQCSIRSKSYDRFPDPVTDLSFSVVTHTYEIKQFTDDNGGRIQVAVHSSVKNSMQQLIKGYRYHRKPRYR